MGVRNGGEGNRCEGNPRDPLGKGHVGAKDRWLGLWRIWMGEERDSGERGYTKKNVNFQIKKDGDSDVLNDKTESNLRGGGNQLLPD